MAGKDLWELQSESDCPFPLAMLTDRSIGDMVLAFGALQILAMKYEQMVMTTNIPQLIHPLAPPNANHHLGWLPWHSKCELFNISVGSSMNPRYGHPIKQILDHLGIESDVAIPQPRWAERTITVRNNPAWTPEGKEPLHLSEPIKYPAYDFLIHLNSDDEERTWGFEHWAEVIAKLLEQWPGCSIGILGTDIRPPWNHHKPDPRPFDNSISKYGVDILVREAPTDGSEPRPGVEYVYNRSFELVGSLVKRAKKAVITIDSAVSRIAHAVGSKNHVLLAPDAYCLEWSAHPGCYPVYGNPKTWGVDLLLESVNAAALGLDILRYEMPPLRRVDAKALWNLRKTVNCWSTWPREGNITLRLEGGFGVVGSEVDLTRLSQQQVDQLIEWAQAANIFTSITTAAEAA